MYFSEIKTMEELRKNYKNLVFTLHPDKGGNEEEFKKMAQEYNGLLNKIMKGENSDIKNDLDDFIESLKKAYNNIKNLKEINIELIGDWLWISGNTKLHKEKLKEEGFKWAIKKQMWYLNDGSYKRRSKKEKSINDIRKTYGTRELKSQKKLG